MPRVRVPRGDKINITQGGSVARTVLAQPFTAIAYWALVPLPMACPNDDQFCVIIFWTASSDS